MEAQRKTGNDSRKIISLSIGDVGGPLPRSAVWALRRAAARMGRAGSFHGYPPDGGEPFLRDALCASYRARGLIFRPGEFFVSDGAKSDLGNLLSLFDPALPLALGDPCYPAVRDAALLARRALLPLAQNPANGFQPPVPDRPCLIYLCSPGNPTGTVLTRKTLEATVDFARQSGSLILFDAAYRAFLRDPLLPASIFEIEGARGCAIEVGSFSKAAAFTGLRCGFSLIPEETGIAPYFARRQACRFNGVAYPVQCAAAAVLAHPKELYPAIARAQKNADRLRAALEEAGLSVYGGENSPYLWAKTPRKMTSMAFFSQLLSQLGLAVTPGSGFGEGGEGFVRFSALGREADVREACRRLRGIAFS